jgi:2-polyprenyl-3-methyl-5-hydroxy-6-metoxy-1,4-benzoquinol methylase
VTSTVSAGPTTPRPHRGPALSAGEQWDVMDCQDCGFVHLDPIPTDDELSALYASVEYYEEYPGWLDKDEREKDYWRLEHVDKLDAWKRLGATPGGRVLDVGCSGGLLLEDARDRGFDVLGIEPSPTAAKHAQAKDIEVIEALFQDVDLPAASFDVVHARLLLEHLPDPRDFVTWAARLLAPHGVLTLQVPNEFNLLQRTAHSVLDKPQWWVAPPFHINYFTFDGLEALVSQCGLQPVERDTSFPVEWFLLMGQDYIGDEAVGASIHQQRMLLEHRLELAGERRPLHEYLAVRGLGREAIVHAQLSA